MSESVDPDTTTLSASGISMLNGFFLLPVMLNASAPANDLSSVPITVAASREGEALEEVERVVGGRRLQVAEQLVENAVGGLWALLVLDEVDECVEQLVVLLGVVLRGHGGVVVGDVATSRRQRLLHVLGDHRRRDRVGGGRHSRRLVGTEEAIVTSSVAATPRSSDFGSIGKKVAAVEPNGRSQRYGCSRLVARFPSAASLNIAGNVELLARYPTTSVGSGPSESTITPLGARAVSARCTAASSALGRERHDARPTRCIPVRLERPRADARVSLHEFAELIDVRAAGQIEHDRLRRRGPTPASWASSTAPVALRRQESPSRLPLAMPESTMTLARLLVAAPATASAIGIVVVKFSWGSLPTAVQSGSVARVVVGALVEHVVAEVVEVVERLRRVRRRLPDRVLRLVRGVARRLQLDEPRDTETGELAQLAGVSPRDAELDRARLQRWVRDRRERHCHRLAVDVDRRHRGRRPADLHHRQQLPDRDEQVGRRQPVGAIGATVVVDQRVALGGGRTHPDEVAEHGDRGRLLDEVGGVGDEHADVVGERIEVGDNRRTARLEVGRRVLRRCLGRAGDHRQHAHVTSSVFFSVCLSGFFSGFFFISWL